MRQESEFKDCIIGLVEEVYDEVKHLNISVPTVKVKPICTSIGDMAFGYALDVALDGADCHKMVSIDGSS